MSFMYLMYLGHRLLYVEIVGILPLSHPGILPGKTCTVIVLCIIFKPSGQEDTS